MARRKAVSSLPSQGTGYSSQADWYWGNSGGFKEFDAADKGGIVCIRFREGDGGMSKIAIIGGTGVYNPGYWKM